MTLVLVFNDRKWIPRSLLMMPILLTLWRCETWIRRRPISRQSLSIFVARKCRSNSIIFRVITIRPPSNDKAMDWGWRTVFPIVMYSFGNMATLLFILLYVLPASHNKSKRVAVLVLGDLGRSPRMQNHAVSLAKAGWKVDLIGSKGRMCVNRLIAGAELFGDVLALKDMIDVHYLPATPKSLMGGGKAMFLLLGPLKVLFQIFFLLRLLLSIPQFSYILVQVPQFLMKLIENPPSIPTIVVARLACTFRSAKLVIDWHNLGYTLLTLRLSKKNPLVILHRWYEQVFSKCAHAHFCVTEMMRRHLSVKYGLDNIVTLMDRPPARYMPLNEAAQSLFLETLPETAGISREKTKIFVTSTSYTPDEPLQPLLSALIRYSKLTHEKWADRDLPRILLLITGRGPAKEAYRKMIEDSPLSGKDPNARCTAKTIWLEPDDYPRLLACADLGISLHLSSSGLDFPMKIVDMYGCGTPVLAAKFKAYV